jgi:hypothetical protein
METMQRHATPAIPPWTSTWSVRRRLGFGIVAIYPAVLLVAMFVTWMVTGVGDPDPPGIVPGLFYVHVASQFITLLVFGHLMIANPSISSGTKLLWGLCFLFLAPLAIPFYWFLHVWHSEPQLPSESSRVGPHDREIHVYDFDYETHRAVGVRRQDDGAILHHIDAVPSPSGT